MAEVVLFFPNETNSLFSLVQQVTTFPRLSHTVFKKSDAKPSLKFQDFSTRTIYDLAVNAIVSVCLDLGLPQG